MSRDLNSLRPEVRTLVDAFLAAGTAAGIDILVTCAYRTNEEQSDLYKQGRTVPGRIVTNAQAGQSAHNYGLAIDVVPIINGKPDWIGAHPVWQQIGKIGQDVGLEWAGAPSYPFHELAHFQLPGWKDHVG